MTGAPTEIPSEVLAQARRILVIKLDGVGDFVLATPFLRGLRACAPAAEIALVVRPLVTPMTVGCPYVDTVAAPVGDPWSGKMNFTGRTHDDLQRFSAAFRAGFDIAVVPRYDIDNQGATPLVAASRAAVRIGFTEATTPWKADANRGFDAAYTHVLPGVVLTDAGPLPVPAHEMDQNLALLAALGGLPPDNVRRPELFLSAGERTAANERIIALFGGVRPRRVIAVVATSRAPRRNYPPDLFARLLRSVASALNAAVLVIAAPDDDGAAAGLTGRLAGLQTALLPANADVRAVPGPIACCDGMVSVDTGTAHIAAAAGIPVAVLSCHAVGGHPNAPSAPERYAPVGRHVLILRPPAFLAPCTDMCLGSAPHCITGISPDDAGGAITGFLREAWRQPGEAWRQPGESLRQPGDFPSSGQVRDQGEQ